MAFQLPKIDLTDAKTRVFIIFGGVLTFIVTIYIGMHFFSGTKVASGPSKVAGAPGGLQSVPGGQLTPEYYRALVQANEQAAKQAQISGGSAVPTLLNEPGAQESFQQAPTPSCSVVCPSAENVTVDNDINDLVKAGKLTAEEGKALSDMAKKNVAVNEYAAQLDELVKKGKLTPEQARKLLDDYKKQHENALLKESGAAMDDLIKSGQLPLDSANELLEMQKKHVSPEEYSQKLSELVKEGKISPETAAQLLAQYTQQHAKEKAAEAMGQLDQMAASGQISHEVANELKDYQNRHVSTKEYAEELQHLVNQGKLTPEQAQRLLAQYSQQIPPDVARELADYQRKGASVADYQTELQRLVDAGKITPEQAQQLLEEYSRVKAPGAPVGVMNGIVKQAEKANEDAIKELVSTGRISQETAQKLIELQHANVPVDEYKRQLDELVKEGKLDPADAQKLLISYMQQKGAGVQDLLASGKISPQTAQKLMEMQRGNTSVEEYKKELDQMVREGKISAADAQRLLNNYSQMKEAQGVQGLVKEGKISQETAQKLMTLQKANVPVEEYKRQLDELVREGKISPADAQKLLVDYMRQRGGGVQDLLSSGKITKETADKLLELQRTNVPVEEYKRRLDEMVREGKISREDADKLLNNYQQIRGVGVHDLLTTGKISQETAQKLMELQKANVPVAEYKRQLDEMVRNGKMSPEQAHKLLADYQKLHDVRDEADKLTKMRANKVTPEEYANELNRAVKAGAITPDQAAHLLQEYKESQNQSVAAAIPMKPLPANIKGGEQFAALEKRLQTAPPQPLPPAAGGKPVTTITPEQLSAEQAKARAVAEQAEQQRLQALMGAMSSQAGQLISSWQPPTMTGQVGSSEMEDQTKAKGKKGSGSSESAAGSSSGAASGAAGGAATTQAPIIKAGAILYAVLDTGVNSDFPDSPVLATIVDGKFKGAKLLGKLAITQGQDRVSLTFKLMNMDEWNAGKTVNAFAIDPDTARTALASNVNYHYFMRYGALMASSFISGYATAISTSGSTTSLSVTGSTTTTPVLSPADKFAAGLGQVGKTLGTAVQSYTNLPPTVVIDPGTSLGILFMADVSG